jgi:endonuclease/exonuclease/phosphatase (EEP) superfamily protein YafD
MAVVSLASVAGFLGDRWWRFDLFSHFRVQYFYILTFGTIVFFIGGRYSEAIVSGMFTLLNLISIIPLYIRSSSINPSGGTYRIILANVLQTNDKYHKVGEFIQDKKPDILFLIEVNQVWVKALNSYLDIYPYSAKEIREDNYGIALYSHHKIISFEILYFSEPHAPSLVANIELDGLPLTIIGTHPPPPKSKAENDARNLQMYNISNFSADQSNHTIILGDFNMTSWSPYFQLLISNSGLRDSRSGFGVQSTWPTDKPLFLVPIDHILISQGINVHHREVGPRVGSDHFPVIMDFSISEPSETSSLAYSKAQ